MAASLEPIYAGSIYPALRNRISGFQVQLRALRPSDLDAALGVVARAMRDNPLHVRALGGGPVTRTQRVRRLQAALLKSVISCGGVLCAAHAGSLVGVLGMASRKPGFPESIKLVAAILGGFSPVTALRIGLWLGQWAGRLPSEPCWHVGPVAVDVPFQGRGVGSAMMDALCSRMDELGTPAYLETDKLVNVSFYRKFGFETIDHATVIGVPNWFMLRQPKTRTSEPFA